MEKQICKESATSQLWKSLCQICYVTPKKSHLHYSRWVSPKSVKSWWCPSPSHCAWATQLLSKKYRSDGDSLSTLRPFWSATDSNSRPLAPKRTPVTALHMNPRQKHHNFDSPINWTVLFPLSNVERQKLSKHDFFFRTLTNIVWVHLLSSSTSLHYKGHTTKIQ